MARDDPPASSTAVARRPQCAVKWDLNLKPKLAIMRQCTSVTDRRTLTSLRDVYITSRAKNHHQLIIPSVGCCGHWSVVGCSDWLPAVTSQHVHASYHIVMVLTVGWRVTVTVTVLVNWRYPRHISPPSILLSAAVPAVLRTPSLHRFG